ncbi:MAG: cyclase family protein [Nitrospirae bacterium]|nr:cyclase family protein [Nitrospirota bacterium]
MRRIVDLGITIEDGLPSDPPMMIPAIDYVDHRKGATQMEQFFPGLKAGQLPGGLGWSLEHVSLTTHSGTHMDAPYHYHPTMYGGKSALWLFYREFYLKIIKRQPTSGQAGK